MFKAFNSFSLFLFILIQTILPSLSSGQDRNDLEGKKKKIQEEIKYIDGLILNTKVKAKSSLDEINMVNKKLHARQLLIRTIGKEVSLLAKQIQEKQDIISSMEKDLENLRLEYSKMIYYAYKNRKSHNKLMFILSAQDFNQAFKRLKYIQQYTSYRKKQAALIVQTKQALNSKIGELATLKADKEILLNGEKSEKAELSKEKREKEDVLSTLKKKEKELLTELGTKQKAAKALEKAIKDYLEKIAKSKGKIEIVLSQNFAKNKGMLPPPTASGIITDNFGQHRHPDLVNIVTNNNGIDISTKEGAKATSVFEGEVRAVFFIRGQGNALIVRHGEYLSVYSNLETVFVKTGDRVTTGQELGLVRTNKSNNTTKLHFEIWKGTELLNPEPWVRPFS